MSEELKPCLDCKNMPSEIPVWVRKHKTTYIIMRCKCQKQTGYCKDAESAHSQWDQMNTRQESQVQSKALTRCPECHTAILPNGYGAHHSASCRLIDHNFNAALPSEIAKDQQHTKCAVCLEDKNTPLRRDEMGGYVCLTCIDKQLDAKDQRISELNKFIESSTVALSFHNETIAAQQRQIDDWREALIDTVGWVGTFNCQCDYEHGEQCPRCFIVERNNKLIAKYPKA